jgi:hypothetical protein
MTKTLTANVDRKRAEIELLNARRGLSHLVDLYNNGQWRRFYKEDAFAAMVRQGRKAVDHWAEVNKSLLCSDPPR